MKLPSENPAQVIECLKSLGLTKYEALVYIALLKLVSATASEIHEISESIRLLISFLLKDSSWSLSLHPNGLLPCLRKTPLPD